MALLLLIRNPLPPALGLRGRVASRCLSSTDRVRIGHVEMALGNGTDDPHLIPSSYLPKNPSPIFLQHLQWMMAKDSLEQDVLLVGPPGAGAVYRRRLALSYAELTRKPVEMLTLSSDTTESDLKQRRELVQTDQGKTGVEFVDQAPVRAAKAGRLLILDGLEKAERNVLPTLNNLLENREMHLEDGSFLVSPRRYAQLGAEDSSFLIPVHENFRVIALGVPAPPYPGKSLDPPLRSRFQIRRVDNPNTGELYENMLEQHGNTEQGYARLLATISGSIESVGGYNVTPFPSNSLESICLTMNHFPKEDHKSILLRAYPLALEDDRFHALMGNTQQNESQKVFWRSLEQTNSLQKGSFSYPVDTVSTSGPNVATVSFLSTPSVTLTKVPCGRGEPNQVSARFVPTAGSKRVLTAMVQEHAVGRDILLISPKGEGKNATAQQFAGLLGYDTHLFGMYSELTSRDLLVRRTTDSTTGETSWEESPLITAARQGDICILDGIEKLRPDVLSSLQSLATDREASLPDGRRLARQENMASDKPDSKVIPVHPSFRIVALGSLTKDSGTRWLTADAMSMFSTLLLASPTEGCIRAILESVNPSCPPGVVDILLKFSKRLTYEVAEDCGVAPMSTRNLIRVVRRVGGDANLHTLVCSVLVADLLPPVQRASLESLMEEAGITRTKPSKRKEEAKTISTQDNTVTIGDFSMKRGVVKRPEMVPFPKFFDIPSHVNAIQDLLQDWSNGERALLLLGNQGVGKNMIVDRICQIANWEREYVQLHRDSTIGQMTLTPSLEDGKIVWQDSPLVRAARTGCALVIDEADKAPVEVFSILKGLVEDGELLLADGRRISRHQEGPGIIKMHPDFTLWILANRPGFPFLGNDFFREVGDCFSTRIVPNPDLNSEINLLKAYAPNVDKQVLRSIASSFADLRLMSDRGDISYPYSTREAVAVSKHLEKFPSDDLVATLHNVLDFDSFDDKTYSMLGRVFQNHGIAVTDYPTWREAMVRSQAKDKDGDGELSIEFLGGRAADGASANPPPLDVPKRGKWDDNNEPHVGGNQWAGGTGGSNTAGLGGRGGPYRLDRGHKVHQVSDEAKAQVTDEAAKAARAMAKRGLEEKLHEIGMGQQEWAMYQRFMDAIIEDIANLRGLLNSVTSKSSEKGWLKRQSHGEIDDTKLIDGVTGDRYIYKRRGTVEEGPIQKPKRLRFVMDCSGSMYRFNGYDERLLRCLEAALLVMESFDGFENRFDYSIVGHSGDSSCIKLVDFSRPPRNDKERMQILQKMIAHSQYCQSGDNTLEAMGKAIIDVARPHDEDEDALVVGVSDANLARYGIDPRELGRIVEAGEARHVKAYCIFIASFGEEADEIKRSLPVGRGHVCMQTSDLPRVVRNILESQMS